jgi:hypothetical protein
VVVVAFLLEELAVHQLAVTVRSTQQELRRQQILVVAVVVLALVLLRLAGMVAQESSTFAIGLRKLN